MNYNALTNLFERIERYEGFPAQLTNTCNEIYQNGNIAGYTSSRNLSDALQQTVTSWNSQGPNVYKFLFGLSTLLNPTGRKLKIMPYYRTISTEESTTLTREQLLAPNPRTQANANIIHICYISKGKTFARQLLDNADNPATRLNNIELILIQDISHFIRVYKDFPGTDANDITIFTDVANHKLMSGITTLLPLLFNIKLKEIPEAAPPEVLEELEDYNKKVDIITRIFAILFDVLNGRTTNTDYENIREYCKDLTELFNFENSLLSTFSKNLAKAHCENATNYVQNEINTLQRNIKNSEQALADYYARLYKYQREYNLLSTAKEDDVKPFMEMIETSKAIEILDGNPTNLRLRITAPLQFFTPSDFEAYERNPSSTYNQTFTDPTVTKIMHKIFVTKEYSLILQSIIKINIRNYHDTSPLNFNAQQSNPGDFTDLPNPHLYRHNCWGQAQNEMSKNAAKGNYELVVMQMIAATQSINVAESASFINGTLSYLRDESWLRKTHIIDNTTKKVYSWHDLIKHEKEQTIEEAKEELTQKQEEQPGYQQIILQDEGLTPEEEAILAQIQNQAAQAHTTPNTADAAQARPDVIGEILRMAASTPTRPEEEPNETH